MRHARTTILLLCSLTFLLGACGNKSDAGSASDRTGSTPATPSSGPTSAGTSPSTPAPTTAECTTSDLRMSTGKVGAAAGSTYVTLVMRNVSDHACRTSGYGGVSLVAGSAGSQVGAPADRTDQDNVRPIVLIPNAHAQATLRMAQAQNYPTATCSPVTVAGFRIYPPNQTASVFLKQAGTGCRNASVHLLSLSPYQPVS